METFTLEKDIKVIYNTAKSFPEGILEAHEKLHSLVSFSTDRKYFGLSRPENGGAIVYKAAAEELAEGEAVKAHLDTMIIKKGNYISMTIHNYMKDVPAIGKAFEELLTHPDIDPDGYCVEWYLSDKDVKCMVRLKN